MVSSIFPLSSEVFCPEAFAVVERADTGDYCVKKYVHYINNCKLLLDTVPSIMYTTYLLRVSAKLEPITADSGWEVRYTLGKLPVYRSANI